MLKKLDDILLGGLRGRRQLKSALGLLYGRIRDGCGIGDVVKKLISFFLGYDMTFPDDMDDESLLSSFLELGSDQYNVDS